MLVEVSRARFAKVFAAIASEADALLTGASRAGCGLLRPSQPIELSHERYPLAKEAGVDCQGGVPPGHPADSNTIAVYKENNVCQLGKNHGGYARTVHAVLGNVLSCRPTEVCRCRRGSDCARAHNRIGLPHVGPPTALRRWITEGIGQWLVPAPGIGGGARGPRQNPCAPARRACLVQGLPAGDRREEIRAWVANVAAQTGRSEEVSDPQGKRDDDAFNLG